MVYEKVFKENIDGFLIRHRPVVCNNKLCCNPKHLLKGSHKDNAQDKYLDETIQFGELSCRSSITEEQAIKIRDMLKSGKYTLNKICEIVGCSRKVVFHISYGNSWKHLGPPIPITCFDKGKKLDSEKVKEIRVLLKQREITRKEIADLYNISLRALYRIQSGEIWKEV